MTTKIYPKTAEVSTQGYTKPNRAANYFGEKFYTGNQDHGTSTNSEIMEICYNDQRVFEEKYKLEKPIWKK